MYPEVFQEERRVRKIEGYDTEDSYMKNYDKKAKSNASSKKAYILKGERIRLGAVSAIHEIIDPDNFSSHSREIDFIDKNYHNHICVSNKSNNFALSST